MTDTFTGYEKGLTRLLERLGKKHPRYDEVLTLQARLLENISQARQYGDAEARRAERAQIVDGLNRLAVDAVGVSFNTLCEPSTEEPLTASEFSSPRSRKIFPGLHPYGVNDAELFFGRDKEIDRLVSQINRDPVVVINGLSGCGKTSLIRAGVIPRLQESGCQVVYTSVFENIIEDVLREVNRSLDGRGDLHSYVEALQELHAKLPRCPLVLIVDQFEQALSPSHDSQALERFLRKIPRLVNSVHSFAKMVIVLRADWLYFLEASARQFYPRLNVHSCIFTLDPLTKRESKRAIIDPLQSREIAYDEAVVDEIVSCLQTSSVGPSVGPYVQPIQLQIVLRALFDLAQKRGSPQQGLTEEIYQESGGVENILRNHLADSLGHRPEAWRLLARFIAPDGETGRTIRRSELLAVPAAQDVEVELRFLINQGFLEAHEAEDIGETFYRLSHDYLVEAIAEYLNQNPDEQGWKLAEDWLASGTLEWRESAERSDEDVLLLERNRYTHIYQYRDKLKLTPDAQRLLVHSALRYGHEGLGYWLSRDTNGKATVEIVTDKLLSSEPEVQREARMALSGCTRQSSDEVLSLAEDLRGYLGDQLRQALEDPANSAERDAAARALWVLQPFQTVRERVRVGGIALRHWSQEHSVRIASYLLTAFLVLALGVGGLYAREKLQGSWQMIRSLKAGTVHLVAADPSEASTVYALTAGGPGPREGNSLFVKQRDRWGLRNRDFSRGTSTSMVVVRDGSSDVRLYITLYGVGVMRSENGGHTWNLTVQGLPSRGLTSLVANPEHPQELYVATDDWRGVLQSLDGGETWNFYDYGGEIFGAMVSEIAYTKANQGTLIAGTEDGRILIHHRNSSNWQLVLGLSKGTINELEVAPSNDQKVYAGTSRGIVLHSQDGGEKWEVLGQPANEFNIRAMAIAPDDSSRLYVSAYGNGGHTIWKSKDGGLTWEMVPGIGLPRTKIKSLEAIGQHPYHLYAATSDGLFLSQDGGINWEQEPLDAPLAHIKKISLNSQTSTPVYVAVGGSIYVNSGSIYKDPQADHQWIRGEGLRAETVRTLVVDPTNPRVAYAGVLLLGEWSVFMTEDGGRTWQRTTPPPMGSIVPDTMALALTQTQEGKTILYAGTIGCGILRSESKGESWKTFGRTSCDQVVGDMPSDISYLAVDAENADLVYAASGTNIYHSADGGFSWQEHKLDTESSIEGLVADPIQSETVYLITRSDGFWLSEDGGETWQKRGRRWLDGENLTAIAAVPGQADQLIVGTSSGNVWTTPDGGATWRLIRENLVVGRITSIATSTDLNGNILIGTEKDGIALFTPGRLLGGNQ
jgi:photosystem II stability/assembly factor-like uncharacterized protein